MKVFREKQALFQDQKGYGATKVARSVQMPKPWSWEVISRDSHPSLSTLKSYLRTSIGIETREV